MTEQQTKPTEAEIAAAKEIEAMLTDDTFEHCNDCENEYCALAGGPEDCIGIVVKGISPLSYATMMEIIARHNAHLHAKIAAMQAAVDFAGEKIAKQKAALELAQAAIEKIEWAWSGPNPDDYKCPACRAFMDKGHKPDCIKVKANAAIMGALS